MKDTSSRQMINAELVARASNVKSKNILKNHIPTEYLPEAKIDFFCECSNESCTKRILLSTAEYEALHINPAQFVVKKGHQTPKIEKVAHKKADLLVVEKYAL